jgi:hypothetical protein
MGERSDLDAGAGTIVSAGSLARCRFNWSARYSCLTWCRLTIPVRCSHLYGPSLERGPMSATSPMRMLTSQPRSGVVRRKMTMCARRDVIRACSARVSVWVFVVTAWAILSATAPGNARDEVPAHTRDAKIVSQGLSVCQVRAYRSYRRRRFGGVDLESSVSELKHEPTITFQPMRVACSA